MRDKKRQKTGTQPESALASILGFATLLVFLLTCVRPNLARKESLQDSLYQQALQIVTAKQQAYHAHHPFSIEEERKRYASTTTRSIPRRTLTSPHQARIEEHNARRLSRFPRIVDRREPVRLSAQVIASPILAVSPATESRRVSLPMQPFSRIEAGYGITVAYTQGAAPAVRVEDSPDASDRLIVDVKNQVLRLRSNGKSPVLVDVVSPTLTGISLSAGARGKFLGLAVANLEVGLEGRSSAHIYGKSKSIRVAVKGSSSLDISPDAAYELSGSIDEGSSMAAGGQITALNVKAKGKSSVQITGIVADEVRAKIDEASSMSAAGITKRLAVEVDGQSSVGWNALCSQSASAKVEGNSSVSLGNSKSLIAAASGGSRITYAGSPQLTAIIKDTGKIAPK